MENRIMPALFSIHDAKNDITCMSSARVDDMLRDADGDSQKIIDVAFAEFDTRDTRADNFRHC
eukprot:5836365-Pyramimonas_sp.AAC.1